MMTLRFAVPAMVLSAFVFGTAVHAADTLPPAAIAPNENLVADGLPPIPADIAQAAGRYSESRAALLADWHPTQQQILILTRFGDTNQVHLVEKPGGARTQLTFFPDRVEGAQFDPREGKFIVLHKGAGGAEFFQDYRYDFSDGHITLLTDGKSRNGEMVFDRAGERAAYTSTRRNGADTDLYVQDPRDPKTDHLLAEVKGGGWDVLDWSPDGKQLLVLEEISVAETYLWLFDAQTGAKTELTPRPAAGAPTVFYGKAVFSGTGRGLYVITDQDSEFHWLAYFDLATRTLDLATPGDAMAKKTDVDDFDLSRDGRRLAWTTNLKGGSMLHLFDLAQSRVPLNLVPGRALGPLTINNLHWHRDGSTLAYDAAGARVPTDVFSLRITPEMAFADVDADSLAFLDQSGGVSERWTTSETGGVPPTEFVQPRGIGWKSFDDRRITGLLYMPDEKKFPGKRPVIINIHGGPEGESRAGFLGRGNYFINELGCAVIFPNVRGSTGFGKTFTGLDNGFKREDSYKDIDALLDWIRTQGQFDADRVMVTGGSYGGHMTLAVSTFYADKIRCSVDVVGMSNLKTFLEHTESYRRDLRRVEYGDERDSKMAEFLEKIAPLNNAQKITKPIFVVQGYNDPRVPRSEAEQIVATLKKQGTPVWFLMAKDEGHGFAKKKNADFQFYATVEFIRQYLLGGK